MDVEVDTIGQTILMKPWWFFTTILLCHHRMVAEHDGLTPIRKGKGFHHSREPCAQIPVGRVTVMVTEAQDLGPCWTLSQVVGELLLILVDHIPEVDEDVLWEESFQPFP